MISNFIRTFVFVWLFIPASVAYASSHEINDNPFQSREVSCSLRSLPGTEEVLQALGRGWYHDKSETDLNAIASRVMDYANQGDPEAMLAWGTIKQRALLKKLIKNKEDRLTIRPLPEDARDDITMAMTYALIVLSVEGDNMAMARMMMRKIEHEMEPILLVPSEWVRQAEKNASQWNSYCGRPTPNFDRYVEAFHPENLSCKSHKISEARERINAVKNNPDGDLYFIGHADEIFDDIRKFADQGDPEAMYFIGSLKYETILISQIHGLDARHISRPFPDYTKPDLLTAMTYIFVSAEIKGTHQENVHELVQHICSCDRQGKSQADRCSPNRLSP